MSGIDMKRPIETLRAEMVRIQPGVPALGDVRHEMLESVEAHRLAIVLLEAGDAVYEAQIHCAACGLG